MFDELLPVDAADSGRSQISFGAFRDAYWERLGRLGRLLLVVLPITFVLAVLGLHVFGGATYTAEMTVAPNRIVNSGSEAAGGGGLSSLIGLQGLTDSQFDLYLSTRESNLLAAKLMATPGIPQQIFDTLWDNEAHQWRPPPGLFPSFKRSISRALGFVPWEPPTSGDIAEYLTKNIKVGTDKRTLITRIEFSNRDPDFAKSLLLTVHQQAEALLREQAQRHTRVMIVHIVHELATVTVTEQREALIQLLSQQEKLLMMIGDNLPYAAVVVDPPSMDTSKGKTRPLLTIFFALIAATIASAAWVGWEVLRDLKKTSRQLAETGAPAGMQPQSYLVREV
jgi:hypothetical protein